MLRALDTTRASIKQVAYIENTTMFARIAEGLGFLGIELDENRNTTNAPVISTKNGSTVVRVIHTDEEYMIARTVCRVLIIDFSNTKSTGKIMNKNKTQKTKD